MAGLFLAMVLISPISRADAQTVTGTIAYPCTFPEFTWLGQIHSQVLDNGVCGWHISVPHGGPFTVTPSGSADLDVYTYNAAGQFDQIYGNIPGLCGPFSYTSPFDTRDLVITLVPSNACAKQNNVGFTYTGP